jgi:hypothetical protein
MRRFLVTAAVAIAGIGGLGLAYAHAQPSDPTVADSQQGTAACRPKAAGRVVHGDLIVKTKNGFENVTVDRGTVKSVSAGSLTLERPDAKQVTVTLTDATKFRGQTREQVAAGDVVRVISTGGTARAVASRKADAPCATPGKAGTPAGGTPRARLRARLQQRKGAGVNGSAGLNGAGSSTNSSDSSDSIDSLLNGSI